MSSTYFFLSSPLCLKSQIFFLAFFFFFFFHRRIFFSFNGITWGKKSSMQSKNFMMWNVDTWDWLSWADLNGPKRQLIITDILSCIQSHRQENMKFTCSRVVLNSPSIYYLEKCSTKEINILLSWLKWKCHWLYILCTTFLHIFYLDDC